MEKLIGLLSKYLLIPLIQEGVGHLIEWWKKRQEVKKATKEDEQEASDNQQRAEDYENADDIDSANDSLNRMS